MKSEEKKGGQIDTVNVSVPMNEEGTRAGEQRHKRAAFTHIKGCSRATFKNTKRLTRSTERSFFCTHCVPAYVLHIYM